jgi:hypothetical protein
LLLFRFLEFGIEVPVFISGLLLFTKEVGLLGSDVADGLDFDDGSKIMMSSLVAIPMKFVLK